MRKNTKTYANKYLIVDTIKKMFFLYFKIRIPINEKSIWDPRNYIRSLLSSILKLRVFAGLLEKRAERRLSGSRCLSHPWLLTTDNMEDTILDTARLRG